VPNLFEEFRAVVAALDAAGVPFAVCGGLAMSIHAHPRATLDIDLLAPAEALPVLKDALRPLGFEQRESAPSRFAKGRVVIHRLTKYAPPDPEVFVLDVIEVGVGVTRDAWQTREALGWEGLCLGVVSREGLVALKRLRGSPQDLADIALLEGRS
jgi:hypothetical protein